LIVLILLICLQKKLTLVFTEGSPPWVNTALVNAYWEIGHRIVEEEQHGARRADYGDALLHSIAITLTAELDKHLDERELRRIRQFYLVFPIRDALRPDLSWTHYRLLLRIEDPKARLYYMQEAAEQGWKTRQLERNIQSGYYSRILVHKEASVPPQPPGPVPLTATDLLKDPYVLEFLGLDMPAGHSESDLETAILSKLHHFLLEMGKGFAFVGRQYSIRTERILQSCSIVVFIQASTIAKLFALQFFAIVTILTSRVWRFDSPITNSGHRQPKRIIVTLCWPYVYY
jgi:predicted nuclease of restriction endonuclease-like (RecB) superfamily